MPDSWINPIPEDLKDCRESVLIRVPEEILQAQRKSRIEAALKAKEARERELYQLHCDKAEKGSGEYIFLIFPQYRKLVYQSHLVFSDWSDRKLDVLKDWGYEKQHAISISGKGRIVVWVYRNVINRKGEVVVPTDLRAKPFKKNNEDSELHIKIQNQSQDHYYSVFQIAALFLHYGFTEVKVNHRLGADVSGIYKGLSIAVEYEREKTRSVDGLKLQYLKASKEHDIVRYIVPSDAYSKVAGALGEESKTLGQPIVISRGSAVLDWLNSL